MSDPLPRKIETDCDGECYGVGCLWCYDAWEG